MLDVCLFCLFKEPFQRKDLYFVILSIISLITILLISNGPQVPRIGCENSWLRMPIIILSWPILLCLCIRISSWEPTAPHDREDTSNTSHLLILFCPSLHFWLPQLSNHCSGFCAFCSLASVFLCVFLKVHYLFWVVLNKKDILQYIIFWDLFLFYLFIF